MLIASSAVIIFVLAYASTYEENATTRMICGVLLFLLVMYLSFR